MRLSRIKLAGFKSFVDPTTIHLPSDLLAIVGPNGCGKSNVIDAVRWVMGEGSAKILRGESMADVIFNGSNARKPVGTATVELMFDNSDGSVGGQYAGYAEISVKRVVSRDGHSQYFLNGTRCRRRDITDLFLGTGLGPRSYSIIEQGMISQVVEARPEDLRAYLEEAAGISKYKERRRETENRIRHTRDNLARLDDLREEVSKQLDHLKRQARAAERYSKLKQEHRRMHAEALGLRWRELKAGSEQSARDLAERQNQLDAALAGQRRVEAELERGREDQHQAGEDFNQAQGALYEVAAEVARLEQAIQHVKELRARHEADLRQVDESAGEINDHIALDEVQVEQLRTELKTREPELRQSDREATAAAGRLQEVETERTVWREAWDSHTEAAGNDARSAEVARTRIDHMDQELMRLGRRRQKLETERRELDTAEQENALQHLDAETARAAEEKQVLQDRLAPLRDELERARTAVEDQREGLDALRQDLQQARGRLSSLEALQQAALGQDRDDAQAWLEDHGLAQARRLAESLSVEPGWELAVEAVLGRKLGAVVCGDTEAHVPALEQLAQGELVLVQAGDHAPGAQAATGLAARVQGPAGVHELLSGVRDADDLAAALAALPGLGAGQSVITRNGEWLGHGWAQVARGSGSEESVLKRKIEINKLSENIATLLEDEKARIAGLEQARDHFRDCDERRDDLQAHLNTAHRQHADLDAQRQSRKTRLEQAQKRLQQIKEEGDQITARAAEIEEELRRARGDLDATVARMAEQEDVRKGLEQQRESLDESFARARHAAKEQQTRLQELNVTVERARTQLASTEHALERMRKQLGQLEARRGQLHGSLEEAESPLEGHQAQLRAQLDERLAAEARLAQARTRLESVDERLRELETQRGKAERHAAELRDALNEAKLEQQRLSVKQEDLAEQIAAAGFDAAEIAGALPEDAESETWHEKLEKLARRIERLEPVNLAAISEYEEQAERKEYLDRQNEDLMEALATLEAAIHKIDRQTRTGFKETFERVNTGLQELFPRLFGGGHAYLEMTGDDLLTTGVTIMARPPGKRVAHIHLLSGGEKALTAVSFVFAIFQLNPAPFCLLDEVDAPLDDANVGRFSDLVREMSEKVQFVVVTHNKGTMEIAHQLIGVTMREAGVSRLVSVDIDAAAEMATA